MKMLGIVKMMKNQSPMDRKINLKYGMILGYLL